VFQFVSNGSVTSVKGIKAAGIFCGVKKRKKDLALIVSDSLCSVAGTFTLNKVKAAPIVISKEIVKQNGKVKAVLVNSGNANACTGEEGRLDALKMQKECADKLGVKPSEVLISSTGVIGQKLPVEKIIAGLDKIIPLLSEKGGIDAANAIITTDKKIKSFAVKVQLSKGETTIGSICKGSGMIMPNMATMLAFITTDAKIDQSIIQKLLTSCVNESFNKISVDGETSTNDMVTLMANGASGVEILKGTKDYKEYESALMAVCKEMAKTIVSDGEGATKLIQVNVTNAKTQADANLVGRAISNSPLVKTALNGGDANWGRIVSAAGNSGADVIPEKISVSFNDLAVLKPNFEIVLDEKKAFKILSQPEFSVNVDLNVGKESSTWWTCDFSEEYIKINADYRT
jgi:glutamate N-acetyltransferase / amino-acid N-acetyltransferase